MKGVVAKLKTIALGQFLSLLVTGGAFASSLLVREGIDAPTLQSFISYFALAVGYGSYLLFKKHSWQGHWGLYLSLAIIDVEANYFRKLFSHLPVAMEAHLWIYNTWIISLISFAIVDFVILIAVKAYQYTSITSVMLLDCWGIPCVLLLTAVILRTRYFAGHYVGVVICVLGLCLVLLSDVHADDHAGGSNALLGDFMVLIGATVYAIANTYEEFLVKRHRKAEILASFGFFAAIVTICQVFILERRQIETIHWNARAILPFLMFTFCQLAFFSLFLILLQTSGSAMFNLSLLSSDMYAVAIRSLVYHEAVDWLYYVAFGTVAVGIVIYSSSGEPATEPDGQLIADKIPYERIGTFSTEPPGSESELISTTFAFTPEETEVHEGKESSVAIELTDMSR
ncbi:hypothetical protein R1sor_016032 [Riccia sorocarpa]|uniref:Solute carrier family 35 member F1 n=1 Tax=Riccia sorocarpa TaxID=122646 RepID=A0ABD3HE98_9MARC